MDERIKLGDTFFAKCGTALRVVNKTQRNQTRSYDLGYDYSPSAVVDLQYYLKKYEWTSMAWLVSENKPAAEMKGHLFLCPVTELDNASNEWGLICP